MEREGHHRGPPDSRYHERAVPYSSQRSGPRDTEREGSYSSQGSRGNERQGSYSSEGSYSRDARNMERERPLSSPHSRNMERNGPYRSEGAYSREMKRGAERPPNNPTFYHGKSMPAVFRRFLPDLQHTMEKMEQVKQGKEVNESSYAGSVEEPLDKRLGRDHLVELLDEVERQVERLRCQAATLEEEKDSISTTIDTIRQSDYVEDLQEGDREEMLFSIERLCARVATVEVAVRTSRNQNQEEALCDVNALIDRLVVDMWGDVDAAKARCLSFLNTCGSEPGPVDKDFEEALLGCALDDQKRVRKRLHGLLEYICKFSVVSLPD